MFGKIVSFALLLGYIGQILLWSVITGLADNEEILEIKTSSAAQDTLPVGPPRTGEP